MTGVFRTGDQMLGMSGGVVLTQAGPDCFQAKSSRGWAPVQEHSAGSCNQEKPKPHAKDAKKRRAREIFPNVNDFQRWHPKRLLARFEQEFKRTVFAGRLLTAGRTEALCRCR